MKMRQVGAKNASADDVNAQSGSTENDRRYVGNRQDAAEKWHNGGVLNLRVVSPGGTLESPAVLRKCKYAFLTLPNYSLIAVANALEPLRMANRLVGSEVYEWSVLSADGRAAEASSGLSLSPTGALDKLGAGDILFVCGGINVREAVSPALLTALRRLAERRVPLGGLCTGGYALARAGLLDNFSATIHWENLSALREEFPRVRINDQLFTIDRDRFTCSGGTAPLDLMLNLIQVKLGPRISQLVSEQFIVERVRKDTDRQYVPLRAQVGVSHRGLIRVAQLMEENIEKPLSLEKIAQDDGPVAPANRTPVQAGSELRAETLLFGNAPAARTRAAAANRHAHHGHYDRLRIPVAAAFFEMLPHAVRLSAERGAQDRRPARAAPRNRRCTGRRYLIVAAPAILSSLPCRSGS